MEDQIKQLKAKRFQLRDKLSQWDKNNKDYNKGLQLAIEYNEIINELKRLGFNAESKVEYVNINYWKSKIDPNLIYDEKPQFKESAQTLEQYLRDIIHNEFKSLKEFKPSTYTYQLTIAWTNDPDNNIDLCYITNYLSEFNTKCIQPISINQIRINNDEEFVLKYEFIGNEFEYNTLKKSIQYIIDHVYAQTEIGFFGKKMY